MEDKTLKKILWGKFLRYVDEKTMKEIFGSFVYVLIILLSITIAVRFEDSKKIIKSMLIAKDFMLSKILLILLFFYLAPVLYRLIKTFVRSRKDALEGIPIDELIGWIMRNRTLKREATAQRFKVSKNKVQKIINKFLELNILIKIKTNNEIVLNPELTRYEDLRSILSGKTKTEQLIDVFKVRFDNAISEERQFIRRPIESIIPIDDPDVGLDVDVPRIHINEPLSIPIGLNLYTKEPEMINLSKNHVLISGIPGYGKTSALINAISHIDDYWENTKLILIDPKRFEFMKFKDSKKLYCPIITEADKVISILSEICDEMDNRCEIMKNAGTKDYLKLGLPTIVVAIDEFNDLMLTADYSSDFVKRLTRMAQMGRGVGIKLLLATQTPRSDVITGSIKANIGIRIAFSVSSAMESRIILDDIGAEKLGHAGYGIVKYGLYKEIFKGVFISEEEIEMHFA